MKVLCIADRRDPIAYSNKIKKSFADIAFVLGCGDMDSDYFDFIMSSRIKLKDAARNFIRKAHLFLKQLWISRAKIIIVYFIYKATGG